MGIGFILGIVFGFALALLLWVILNAARRRHVDAGIQERSATKIVATQPPPDFSQPKGVTEIIKREGVLDQQLSAVKDILLALAESLRQVDSASGAAEKSFTAAQESFGQIDIPPGNAELEAAHALLLREVDTLVNSNKKLRSDLAVAKDNMAEHRKQIDELRTAVRVDTLTQLPNRAAFDERLAEALAGMRRLDDNFSLMMVDIDFFKKINDTHGHLCGDRVLKGVALKMRASLRGHDFIARYGGEEFGVLFPRSTFDDAQMAAERMREAIGNAIFNVDGKQIRITVSGGLAHANDGDNAESLIARADKALYRAKSNGRNQICPMAGDESRIL